MTLTYTRFLFSDGSKSIELVEEFVRDTPTFAAYQTDTKTRSAVERQLGIIGEAVNQLRRVEPDEKLLNTKHVVDFRNRPIHSYDNVNDAIVWAIIKNHLPALKTEVQQRLAGKF